MSLIQELKRRNVLRVVGLYLVIAWLILQVAGLLVDLLELPAWSGKLVFALLLLAFPLVVVFAWAFEITPDGIKREADIDRTASTGAQAGRKLNYITALLGGAAILLIVAQFFVPALRPGSRTGTAPVAERAGSPAAASIAVLPFANLSSDQEQEYFSDGLSEELLNLLAKIPELTVISRTSSFQFKGRNEDVRLIGQKLGVAHLLEGSVRRSGDTLRITAQLINAATGSHVWSNSYDRPFNNVFAVQDEIAAEVVKALRVKLLDAAPQVSVPRNTAAYDLLLQARDVINRRRSAEDFSKAIALVEQAIALEPNYARAWVDLSRLVAGQAGSSYAPFEAGYEQARRAAQRAIQLDARLPDAYVALANIAFQYDWNWAQAEAHIRNAEVLDPASLFMLNTKANLATTDGRLDEAITILRRIIDRDPLRPGVYGGLGAALHNAGRFDEAEVVYRKAIELNPDYGQAHFNLALAQLLKGKAEEALSRVQEERDPFWRATALPMVYHALQRTAERDASLKELEKCCAASGPYQLAQVHAHIGNIDTAFMWLERAYRARDPGIIQLKSDILVKSLRSDPRYTEMVRMLRLRV